MIRAHVFRAPMSVARAPWCWIVRRGGTSFAAGRCATQRAAFLVALDATDRAAAR